jgi:capsular polysaccharide transport system permease protein
MSIQSKRKEKPFQQAVLALALAASVLSVLYWGVVASDRYISESHVIIQSTSFDSGQTLDLASFLQGATPGNIFEQLLLRDYLLSTDLLKDLDAKLNLRAHYSDSRHDIVSRLWGKDEKLEEFHDYFLSRVNAEFDDYSGVLVIRAQAYDPETAHAITEFMVKAGETFMNRLAQQLAQEQVAFLNQEIEKIKGETTRTRQQLLDYQDKHNLLSPQAAAENINGIVNNLEAKLTDLQTQRAAMLGYLMPDSAKVTEINLQIGAVEQQLSREKARLTSSAGKTLNRTLDEYQRLQMNAEFAQDLYKGALVALEKGRYEASRTLKKMSVLQQPTYPEYPLEPRRIYNCVVYLLLILVTFGITQLIAAIIRDHKD